MLPRKQAWLLDNLLIWQKKKANRCLADQPKMLPKMKLILASAEHNPLVGSELTRFRWEKGDSENSMYIGFDGIDHVVGGLG
jgi:hypothetical protein